MKYTELMKAAREYAESYKAKHLISEDIEDAFYDGYLTAIEEINSLLDRRNMSLNVEKLDTAIKDYYYSYDYADKEKDELEMCIKPIFMFVDYINDQLDQ
jgi:hypothetical protein